MQQKGTDAHVAADALRTLILDHRDQTETGRQLADPIVEALVEHRLGRLALTADHGGLAVPPPDALAVFETLADAEASVAWIVWNSTLPCWFGRFLSDDARRAVFGDAEALYASSTRPSGRAARANAAYTVNGRWSLVSGCMHASWIPVMCLVEEDGELEMLAPGVPHMRLMFVPRDAHEIVDTWHVGGLRGTGSHDCVLTDEAVPEDLSFAVGDPNRLDSPFGRVPIACTMSAGCAAICLGIARASFHALLDLAKDKVPVDGGPGLRDLGSVQSLIARTDEALHGIRDRLRSVTEALWETAVAGPEVRPAEIAAVFSASLAASQTCRTVVSDIHAAAGTSALYTDSPIERGHRDIHAVSQHIVLQPFWLEQAGRVRLGLETTHPLFLI